MRLPRHPTAAGGEIAEPPPPGGSTEPPLSADHFLVLAAARRAARPLRRAAAFASVSGWTMGLFAAITLVTGFSSPPALLLAVGMGMVAWNELRGASMLRRFDDAGPRRLALGQVAFGVILAGYAGWMLVGALLSPAAVTTGDAQVDALLAEADLGALVRTATVGLYAGLAVLGVVVPGLTALYYATRRGALRPLGGCPDWAVQAIRE